MEMRMLATTMLLALATIGCQPAQEPGITLPEGFTATIVHEGVGPARHMVVRDNGDIYVALRQRTNGGGIACLRDADKNGSYETIEYAGKVQGTGIALDGEWLYFAEDFRVVRFELPKDSLTPVGDPELIVSNFAEETQHAAKSIDIGADGKLYINCGAPANACQVQMRTPGSPGMDPCPILDYAGGIWVYDANKPNQQHTRDGTRFATGLRNCVAIDEKDGAVYAVMHGRDQLDSLFPKLFSPQQNADLPAEEMFRLTEGSDGGWPYTYYDPMRAERMLAPEYGGDGNTPAEEGKYDEPIQAFPAHWAPNAVLIYEGEQFPEWYRGGAFVAFHGSWNRAPELQAGYNVTFTPFKGGLPSGAYELFADGFAGKDQIRSPREAAHRPMGLAQGPDGSLFICDSVKGTIWRVTYSGDRD